MTETLKHDEGIEVDGQSSRSPLRTDPQHSRFRIASSILNLLHRCCALLGYLIVIGVVVAGLLEIASWIIWTLHPMNRAAELENQIGSPVYEGTEWAQEFWREEYARRKRTTTYVPFRIWGVANWHSKYINNDEGVRGSWRRTINPDNCSAPGLTVWMFGGSTMYGTGVPDWATIPSYVSRELNQGARDCVVVSNFGVEGYVTDQELILLQEQLKTGRHPDVVISYDGFNDSSLAWPPQAPPNAHGSFRMVKKRVEGSISGRLDFLQKLYSVRLLGELLTRLHAPKSFAPLVAAAQPNVIAILSNYEGNMELARVLAQAYKFKLYCFWQPTLVYGHKPFVPFEQQMATRDASGDSADSAWFLTNAAVYREAELHSARDGQFVFLGHLFDSTSEPVYVDEAHLGPRGNEIAAQAITKYIQDHPEK